jgi:hypothetical protein
MKLRDPLLPFLYANQYVNFKSPSPVAEKAAELAKEGDVERAKLYNAVYGQKKPTSDTLYSSDTLYAVPEPTTPNAVSEPSDSAPADGGYVSDGYDSGSFEYASGDYSEQADGYAAYSPEGEDYSSSSYYAADNTDYNAENYSREAAGGYAEGDYGDGEYDYSDTAYTTDYTYSSENGGDYYSDADYREPASYDASEYTRKASDSEDEES